MGVHSALDFAGEVPGYALSNALGGAPTDLRIDGSWCSISADIIGETLYLDNTSIRLNMMGHRLVVKPNLQVERRTWEFEDSFLPETLLIVATGKYHWTLIVSASTTG